jgi:hypothetical protein
MILDNLKKDQILNWLNRVVFQCVFLCIFYFLVSLLKCQLKYK